MKKKLFFILIFFTTTSCTTMLKDDCEKRQWTKQGMEDALGGFPKTHYENQKLACSKYNIKVNKHRYLIGYYKGLKSFCTFKGGYEFGLLNKKYDGACPKENENEFFKGYASGKQQAMADKILKEKE